jgi:hypothetical protein
MNECRGRGAPGLRVLLELSSEFKFSVAAAAAAAAAGGPTQSCRVPPVLPGIIMTTVTAAAKMHLHRGMSIDESYLSTGTTVIGLGCHNSF